MHKLQRRFTKIAVEDMARMSNCITEKTMNVILYAHNDNDDNFGACHDHNPLFYMSARVCIILRLTEKRTNAEHESVTGKRQQNNEYWRPKLVMLSILSPPRRKVGNMTTLGYQGAAFS